MLHLLNYDHVRTPEMQDIAVEISRPSGKQAKTMHSLSPDMPGAGRPLHWKGDRTVSFRVPSLDIYMIVVIELDEEAG